MTKVLSFVLCSLLLATAGFAADKDPLRQIGVASVDITPTFPIRLSGYAVRKTESTNAAQKLWTKALVIGSDKEGPSILITVDNTGVPKHVRDEVVARLAKKKINPDRIVVCSSHSHTTPYLAGYLPTLFGEPLPADHQAHVDQYTRDLADAMERAALAALKNRKPGRLAWAQGKAGFAMNRRTKGGPVDHDLPMLVANDAKGNLRAILINYACHCTTLGGEFNQVCGDWAGYTQEYLEHDHPGATVLVAIGCGADANPQPRVGLNFAQDHGREITTNINQLLSRKLTPLPGKLICAAKEISLPLDTLPTRADFETRANQAEPYSRYHARHQLAKLDRGEALPTKIPYLIATWTFGNDLAMVFLPGEVVVDYSLRLKKEFDPTRTWVNAYANDVPCYIPSERILKEGGYEGGGAMTFYGWPTRIAPGVENLIINTVHELMPKQFLYDEKKAEMPPPKSPDESLAAIETKPGLEVQLVASEPLIVSPVAIDWGADGKLWVVEMLDYPSGIDGNWKPGGRVKYLEDTNGDGKYDKATIAIDNIPFPTGVTPWRNGALVCTAPDILFTETSPYTATKPVRKIFSGFYTDNYQARVNSLSLGLDNWIYGANGLLGGNIRGIANGKEVDIRGRDFRMNPDTGDFEPVSGLTQQGRVRDDLGNWFGCDNSTLFWHYPIPDHYVRRNPHVAAPTPRLSIASGENPNILHPISRTLERFNQPQSANHATSVCGLGVYRDNLLGASYTENLFACEPVHNLVRRGILKPNSVTFAAERAPDEQQSEFLASRDNWFRPVQARTGPDGALYVVDMYRFVIEHPRWISAERLAKLDVRAGADKGRIYRVVPQGTKFSAMPNLRKLSTAKLVAALDTPNGTLRDLTHLELTQRGDKAAVPPLSTLARTAKLPAVRLQALAALDGLKSVAPDLLLQALADNSAPVRANAIRIAEQHLKNDRVLPAVLRLANDSELTVRYQLALSLGESKDARAGDALARLAARDMSDNWMRAAIISSASPHFAAILKSVLATDAKAAGRSEMISQLIATAAGEGNPESLANIITLIAPRENQREAWQLSALNSLLDALDRKNISFASLNGASEKLSPVFSWAADLAQAADTKDTVRAPAIRLLGRNPQNQTNDLKILVALVDQPTSASIQTAVFDTLKRARSPQVPAMLLRDWARRAPGPRQACLNVMLSRDEWTLALLKALTGKIIVPTEISSENRQRLLTHRNQEIQHSAAELFKAGGSRKEILAKYQTALSLTGDASRGSDVFSKNCANCHFLRGQGHSVGPNLAALADKPPGDFLLAILDPNAVVEPRYVSYDIETKDDRSLNGVVSAETATTLTLIQGGGASEKILRSDIASMRASGLSLMPEGLEQAITPEAMADLIAFLKTSPRTFGSATPEVATAAKKSFLTGGVNGLAKIITAVEQLPYPSWMGELPLPYCRQTDGNSKLVWQTAATPTDLKPDGVFVFRLPVAMGFNSNPSGTFSLKLNGKAVLSFTVALNDQTWRSTDGKVEMSYTVMENNNEDSNGVLLIRVADSLLEAGEPATFEVTGSAANSQRWFGIYLTGTKQTASAKKQSLAEQILDDATPGKEREALIAAHPEQSAALIAEMAKDIPSSVEEYKRIPWIWRVAIAAGKRNDALELQRILEVSAPKAEEPLRDWQAVVIGGGLINGLSLTGVWPQKRLMEVLNGKPELHTRCHRTLELASAMADNNAIKTGTRYDALRIVAMGFWEKSGDQLVKYLAKGVNAELQQGAISGLSDMESTNVAPALISGLSYYSEPNRNFALDALLRTDERINALLDALAAGRLSKADLGEKRIQQLTSLKSETLAARARTVIEK